MSEHDSRSKKPKREAEVYRRGVGKTYPGVGDSFAGVGDTFPGIGNVPLVGETFPGLDVGVLFAGEESSVTFGDLDALELRIGYSFNERMFLERALTHPSYANERKGNKRHNQRLEFLGDSVLGLIIATALYQREEMEDEGMLTKHLSALVCERALSAKARELDLGDFLRLGKGEEAQGGRLRDSILCDAYEALIAAIYLDGGYLAVRDVALRLHQVELTELQSPLPNNPNYKGLLQSSVQARYNTQPTYHIVDEHGPEHRKMFVAEVRVLRERMGRGEGRSKKLAEQAAAEQALALFVKTT